MVRFTENFSHPRPFTREQAFTAGITAKQLEGPRFERIFRGVYIETGLKTRSHTTNGAQRQSQTLANPSHGIYPGHSLHTRAAAALLLAPPDALISHTTALAIYGLDLPGKRCIHVSTNEGWVTRVDGIKGHRRIYDISRRHLAGLSITGPERTLVDVASIRSLPWVVAAGDFLLQKRLTKTDLLSEYAQLRHLHGVQRLREAMKWIRHGAESPMESVTRLLIQMAGLPEPATQFEVFDQRTFVARVDLAYISWKIAIEYDGKWHERSSEQRAYDRDRREKLERLGWHVVTIYESDLDEVTKVPLRVFEALRSRSYRGASPTFGATWRTHIPPSNKIWSA